MHICHPNKYNPHNWQVSDAVGSAFSWLQYPDGQSLTHLSPNKQNPYLHQVHSQALFRHTWHPYPHCMHYLILGQYYDGQSVTQVLLTGQQQYGNAHTMQAVELEHREQCYGQEGGTVQLMHILLTSLYVGLHWVQLVDEQLHDRQAGWQSWHVLGSDSR